MTLASAYDFSSLARVLGCTPKQLGYYLHKRPLTGQYRYFPIPKKSGGFRLISAPATNLKLIQKSIAKELDQLRLFKPCVNGFVAKRNIRRNASAHVGQRFILNIDLEDFFGSINFGRIYGMLQKPPYSFAGSVAAAIAKACTLDDKLPQGAPTSPILSNLICTKMDAELSRFAAANRCNYSRYADDLTFSTRRPVMPFASAIKDAEGVTIYELDATLRAIIENNGFRINEKKVRLRDLTARQEVTGLIVNRRVNVKRRYIRDIRAMLHAWRKFGLSAASTVHQTEHGGRPSFESVVRGRIEFVGHIRGRQDPLFRKLADQFNSLTTGGRIRTLLTAEEIARGATWIIESDSDEQGTAFFLHGVGLISCSHCVGPNAYIWHPDFPTKKYRVTLVREDRHRDLALLEGPTELRVQGLALQNAGTLRDGTNIVLLGYPNHRPGSSIRVEPGAILRSIRRSAVDHYEITPKIIGGNSGGPVVTDAFEVAGIAVRGVSGTTTLSTAEFIAINAEELRRWLAAAPTT
jgi:retron-type reverse transcriptase